MHLVEMATSVISNVEASVSIRNHLINYLLITESGR